MWWILIASALALLLGVGVVFWGCVSWVLPSKSRCRKCRYDLTGCRSAECPECGHRRGHLCLGRNVGIVVRGLMLCGAGVLLFASLVVFVPASQQPAFVLLLTARMATGDARDEATVLLLGRGGTGIERLDRVLVRTVVDRSDSRGWGWLGEAGVSQFAVLAAKVVRSQDAPPAFRQELAELLVADMEVRIHDVRRSTLDGMVYVDFEVAAEYPSGIEHGVMLAPGAETLEVGYIGVRSVMINGVAGRCNPPGIRGLPWLKWSGGWVVPMWDAYATINEMPATIDLEVTIQLGVTGTEPKTVGVEMTLSDTVSVADLKSQHRGP